MAATNVNRIVISGNITRDPELRPLPSGGSVCKMRLANNTRRRQGDEWVDKPNYFDITVWGGQGETCARVLTKGSPITVDGRLEWREFEIDDTTGQAVEIVAENVQFHGSPPD